MLISRFLHISLMTLLIGFSLLSINLVCASEDTANLAIETAEIAMITAYEAVIEAEQAGGDVTDLLARLNEAGEFLANARVSYRNENFDNATSLADLSRNIGEEVKNTAYELKDLAWNEGVQRMWFTMIGSMSGIVLVILGSLSVWRFLKRRY